MNKTVSLNLLALFVATAALTATMSSCTGQARPEAKRIPADQEFAGFLSDYSKLAPSPLFKGQALTYARVDAEKSLRHYFAVIVDPVDVYLASNAAGAEIPEASQDRAKQYFQWALTSAVSDAYPVAVEPGPLVLRLRSALVGVDTGDGATLDIGKVGVEMELLDSETGEQIAAMVDRAPLGEGASLQAAEQPADERSMAVRTAFDEWASRVREFLDSQYELSEEDQQRASDTYQPY